METIIKDLSVDNLLDFLSDIKHQENEVDVKESLFTHIKYDKGVFTL